ncbi:hypothetical protein TSMG0157 [Halocynthia phage JM-2012]|uniref:RNA polymerase beta subunit n=1 Tax=Halocynthia phage JM-2012 TaxID=1173297 RepID=UPI00025C6979|nr:RNA polymerase beta subunit [Halocynthia phage JM-2012]AFI55440.1 hypothetical protein TSMG0157 [Halocynthia phage JM-2012]
MDRVLGGGGLNGLATQISGGRLGMAKPQFGQYIPQLDAEPPQLLSGTEADHADSTWDIRIESDSQVQILKIIDKYRVDGDRVFNNPEQLIVYKDLDTFEIGSVVLPKFMSHHTTFGFSLINRRDINEGDILEPNAILAHGPSKTKEGNFAYGREVNTAYIGTFGTNEDGAEAAMAVKGMYKSEIITETEIYVDSNFTLLDLFGDSDYFKPLPSIGDTLNPMGLLAVKRELRNNFKLLNTSKRALSEVQRPFDQEIYNLGGAEVIDITVIKGKKVKTDNLPGGLVSYLDALANNSYYSHRQVIDLDNQLRRNAMRNAGGVYRRHPSWHISVRDAERLVGERIPNKPEPSITRTDAVISSYYIKITTRKINTPKLGHKFTGLQAEKFVICNFKPDEDMPTDKWGRFSHFNVNPVGVINRNNPSQLLACMESDACYHTRRQMLEMQKEGADYSKLWDFLIEFYRLISPHTHALVAMLTTDADRTEHVKYVLENRIDLEIELGDPHNGYPTISAIKGTPYYPPRDLVKFRTAGGKMVMSRNPCRISNKYVYPMEKIGSHSSACNIALRQSTGFAAKHSSRLKKYSPMSTQSSRCFGESEFRDIIHKAGPKVARLLMNLNSNALATKRMADELLTNLGLVDLSDVSDYPGRGLSILKHLMECFGYTLTDLSKKESK